MVGLSLSAEQINQAPPEVRRWLEQQVSDTLGFRRSEPVFQQPERHLLGCGLEEARAILSMIQGLLPVTSVFFELGRENATTAGQGLRALRLEEISRHARLQAPQQVIACLRALDQAAQQVTGRPDAALTVVDPSGTCLVADLTARSILTLWQEIVAAHDLKDNAQPAPYQLSMPPFTTTGQTSTALP